MATLREVRRKIRSAANIKKITQAMEMVAASHLRRAQAKAEQFLPYFLHIKEMLATLIYASEDLSHPLMKRREIKKIGVIILAADRGLCGAYNHSIFSATEKFIKKYPPEQIRLLTIGKKALEYFSTKKWKIIEKITDWGGKITPPEISEFTGQMLKLYFDEEIDEAYLIYTHYISVAVREVRIEKILSFDPSSLPAPPTTNYIFEPNPKEILEALFPQYYAAKIQQAMNEAYASELSARIFSMRAATKNAEEMIERLTLLRNKVRQASITNELIEICAGAENLQ